MFHLFGKKKEEAPAQKPEKKGPAPMPSGFDGDEVPVLAITGPGGFADRKDGCGQPYSAIELTAWMEEDGAEIHQGSFELAIPRDEELIEYLKEHVPHDFILKFTARLNQAEDRLLLMTLPVPGFDPDLKAILDKQKEPVIIQAEGIGELTLNRSTNWFQTDADWCGGTVQLIFDRGPEEELAATEELARAMLADADGWSSRLCSFAAEQLPKACPSTQLPEDLAGRLEAESLQLWPDGRFEVWLRDADYLWEPSVRVTGTVSGGPCEVELEG